MTRRYYCKCGVYFGTYRHIVEHIGICNPHWPATREDDEHLQVTEDEYWSKRHEQYRTLREG